MADGVLVVRNSGMNIVFVLYTYTTIVYCLGLDTALLLSLVDIIDMLTSLIHV